MTQATLLLEAFRILVDYPIGQDDGSWIRRKEAFIEKMTDDEEPQRSPSQEV